MKILKKKTLNILFFIKKSIEIIDYQRPKEKI